MSGRTRLGVGLTQQGSDEGGSTGRTSQQIEKYHKRKKTFQYKKNPRGKIIKIGMLSGGQTKIAKKAPPFDKIDEKDFAVLRAEKAKGRGKGLQDEKMKPGKVMKAKRGKFAENLKKSRATPVPLFGQEGVPDSKKKRFPKNLGKFPAVSSGGKGPRGMGKIANPKEFLKRRMALSGVGSALASPGAVKQGTKRLGTFIPRRLKLVGAALSAAGVGAVGQKLIDKMKKKKKKKELEGDIKGSIAPYKMKKKMGGGLAAATERLRAQGKMGGGMMKKYSNGGDVYGKMADKKFEKYATSKEAQLHAKDFDAGLNRAERRAASETMLAYKKKQKLGKQAAVKKMGGGMMNKPMGYKSGKSVMAKGCKLGRKKPTKMYT